MTTGSRALAGGLAVLSFAALGALSRAPYPWSPPAHAVIRLTWRASSSPIEECRRLPSEELARMPAHMRREEICEGRTLPYRLVVVLDGATAADASVEPSGARADRPLYVFHEIAVDPGVRLLELEFVREDVLGRSAGDEDEARGGEERRGEARRSERLARADEERREETGGDDDRVREGHAGRAQETPALLQFKGRLVLEPRQVALITYDPERRTLVLKGYGHMP